MNKKLLSNRGETLLELLVSVLIVSLLFTALCTAMVVANRINKTVLDVNQSFKYDDAANNASSVQKFTAYIVETDKNGTPKANSDIVKSGTKVTVWTTMKEDPKNGNNNPKYAYFEKKD